MNHRQEMVILEPRVERLSVVWQHHDKRKAKRSPQENVSDTAVSCKDSDGP